MALGAARHPPKPGLLGCWCCRERALCPESAEKGHT